MRNQSIASPRPVGQSARGVEGSLDLDAHQRDASVAVAIYQNTKRVGFDRKAKYFFMRVAFGIAGAAIVGAAVTQMDGLNYIVAEANKIVVNAVNLVEKFSELPVGTEKKSWLERQLNAYKRWLVIRGARPETTYFRDFWGTIKKSDMALFYQNYLPHPYTEAALAIAVWRMKAIVPLVVATSVAFFVMVPMLGVGPGLAFCMAVGAVFGSGAYALGHDVAHARSHVSDAGSSLRAAFDYITRRSQRAARLKTDDRLRRLAEQANNNG